MYWFRQKNLLYPNKGEEGTSILNFYIDYDLGLIDYNKISRVGTTKIYKYKASQRDKSYKSYFINMTPK